MRSRLQFAAAGVVAASCALAGLLSCSRAPSGAYEQVMLEEHVQLTRTGDLYTATREWVANDDATCVAIAEENDTDLTLNLSAKNAATPIAPITVESRSEGLGIEVAAIHVPRATRIVLSLSAPARSDTAGRSSSRVSCYPDATAMEPGTAARIQAYMAWTRATPAGVIVPAQSRERIADIDRAIASLESPAGDPHMAAWARFVRANLLYDLDLGWSEAYHAARGAETAFTALVPADARNVARARYVAAMALVEIVNDGAAKNPTAAEAQASARALLLDLARPGGPLSGHEHLRVLNMLGLFCYQIDDYPCAERYWKNALAKAREKHSYADEMRITGNLGVLAMERGDYVSSSNYFSRALARADALLSFDNVVALLVSAAFVEATLGDTAQSIELLTRAQTLAARSGSMISQGHVAYGLGYTYWLRGDLVQAEAFHAEALRMRRLATDSNGLNASLRVGGMLARENGNLPLAIELHREATAHAVSPALALRAKFQLARDYSISGDHDRAIEILREALAIDSNVAPLAHAQTRLAVIENQLARGATAIELKAAPEVARFALELAIRQSNPLLEVQARRVQAALLAASDDLPGARREYERTIAVIFDFRGTSSSPELQATSLAHEQQTFREYVDLLMRGTVARGPGRFATATAAEENALRVLELARALNFEAVRDLRLDPAKQARLDDLLQQMAGKRVRMAALLERSRPQGRDLEQLQLDMAHLRLEVDRLRGPSAKVPASELPSLVARPWSPLAPGVVQLSYALGKGRAYVWVRDERGLQTAVLNESPAQIERKLDALTKLNQVREAENVQSALLALSGTLLPPRILATHTHSVDVVAEGRMANVPFAALRSPLDRTRRLVETHSVRMITSMFETRGGTPAPRRRLAFVGVSGGMGKMRSAARVFPGLGTPQAEGQMLASLFEMREGESRVKLLTGAEGDAASIKSLWSGGADVMHFATHGLANLRHPMASLLLLPATSKDGEPAYLTAGQVQEWQGDTGLVFLGACETAAGPARFGDGIPGLPRAFLRAGAHGVIATLWPVEDVAASQFSIDFYRRFTADGDAARALAETQRAWLTPVPGESAANHAYRLMTAWAHVFYVRSSE
jgi:CHAT domain-containing protein